MPWPPLPRRVRTAPQVCPTCFHPPSSRPCNPQTGGRRDDALHLRPRHQAAQEVPDAAEPGEAAGVGGWRTGGGGALYEAVRCPEQSVPSLSKRTPSRPSDRHWVRFPRPDSNLVSFVTPPQTNLPGSTGAPPGCPQRTHSRHPRPAAGQAAPAGQDADGAGG